MSVNLVVIFAEMVPPAITYQAHITVCVLLGYSVHPITRLALVSSLFPIIYLVQRVGPSDFFFDNSPHHLPIAFPYVRATFSEPINQKTYILTRVHKLCMWIAAHFFGVFCSHSFDKVRHFKDGDHIEGSAQGWTLAPAHPPMAGNFNVKFDKYQPGWLAGTFFQK